MDTMAVRVRLLGPIKKKSLALDMLVMVLPDTKRFVKNFAFNRKKVDSDIFWLE